MTKHQNDISKDLRELVSSLLVHEDDRPSPDQIVSHPFFKMCFVPAELSKEATAVAPKWPNIRPPSAQAIQRGYSDSWFRVCSTAGVGEYAPGKTFAVQGGRKTRSVVRDCEKEMAVGRQPIVPLPADIVYEPFPERDSWASFNSSDLSDVVEQQKPVSDERCLTEIKGNEQRQRIRKRSAEELQPIDTAKENERPAVAIGETTGPERFKRIATVKNNTERRPKNTIPVRMPHGTERPTRTLSAQVEGRAPSTKAAETKAQSGSMPPPARPGNERKPSPRVEEPTVAKRLPSPKDGEPTVAKRPPTPEDPRAVPLTDPVSVLARVSKLRDNLAQALNKRNSAPRRSSKTPQLPFVSKWVDYSRKHGVGYILDDGSIGCIINATSRRPVTYVNCRNGYHHLGEVQKNPAIVDTVPFEFYSENDSKGIKRVKLEKDRKRSTQILWVKFGRYMCQQLGQTDTLAEDTSSVAAGGFVRFYQRLGGTGVWGFGDGAFQV